MTRPTPTIIETYARHRAAAVIHTPFGVLLEGDMACLIRVTARDCGVPEKQARDVLLQHWMALAAAKTAAMTPAERRAMTRTQARSFARAEAGFGRDADESAYRDAHRKGDTAAMKRLDAEATAWLLAFDRALGEVDNG